MSIPQAGGKELSHSSPSGAAYRTHFGSKAGSTRYSASALRMGTRISFLGCHRPGIGHPLFFRPPFHDGNVIGHIRGPGPASLNSGYGSTHRSINYGVPFGKGMGVFSRSGQHPVENSAPVSNQLGEILGTGTASTGDQQVAGFEPGSRHVENGTSLTWVRAQLR